MVRVVTKIGNVFSVKLDEKHKCYFQYVANDLTQLNSDVIRAFRKKYPQDATPDLSEVIKDDVAFYAHCVTNLGVKMGLWEKVGKEPVPNELNVLFRDTKDYGHKLGEEPIKTSEKWYVWKINEEFRHVGKLEGGDNQQAEIGMVINPLGIVHRIKTGKYNLPFYPKY